jgi:hypothetical protein
MPSTGERALEELFLYGFLGGGGGGAVLVGLLLAGRLAWSRLRGASPPEAGQADGS